MTCEEDGDDTDKADSKMLLLSDMGLLQSKMMHNNYCQQLSQGSNVFNSEVNKPSGTMKTDVVVCNNDGKIVENRDNNKRCTPCEMTKKNMTISVDNFCLAHGKERYCQNVENFLQSSQYQPISNNTSSIEDHICVDVTGLGIEGLFNNGDNNEHDNTEQQEEGHDPQLEEELYLEKFRAAYNEFNIREGFPLTCVSMVNTITVTYGDIPFTIALQHKEFLNDG